MAEYKLFIPCAGTGSRLGKLTEKLNKALVDINHVPVISRIIEQFPIDIEIVIALGHAKDILKDFLLLVYPERKITFVEVDKYEGSGSGLGYTIKSCKNELQCPFVFWANDTLFNTISQYQHWVTDLSQNYLACSLDTKIGKYRSLKVDDGKVIDILDEQTPESYAYVGVAGIKDYKQFWAQIESIDDPNYGEASALFDSGVDIIITLGAWQDVGNIYELEKTRTLYPDQYNILDKTDEEIWFANKKVIKFNNNPDVISKKISRVSMLDGFIPKIIGHTNHLMVYENIEGETVADKIEGGNCTNIFINSVFTYIDNFLCTLPAIYNNNRFRKGCNEFYLNKTIKRIKLLSEQIDINEPSIINGTHIRPISTLITCIDFDTIINKSIPCRWHGDLHFDNIIASQDGFKLIDWRPDFDEIDYGDIYYEFAKINHSIILPNSKLAKQDFIVNKDSFSFQVDHNYIQCSLKLKELADNRNLDWYNIELLTYLIYINMAPLHQPKETLLLYLLGLYGLNQLV